MVCVHGLGRSYRYWPPFARALAQYATTIAVGLPGFGRTRGPSQALDVRQLYGRWPTGYTPRAGARRPSSPTRRAARSSWTWPSTRPTWWDRSC
ncbi:alpha/beta fold hydrolase [Streptomyces flavidovirens]|uniref:Alpha/beta fold hydrolase n=1 Tax=Streptomyces flavidovirens TaxID=67298 RepID=A0ABW6RQG9_9ACTN